MRLAILSLALAGLLAACTSPPAPGPTGPIGLETPTASPVPTLVLLPTVPPLPTPALSPVARASTLMVVNTEGSGVTLRDQPGTGMPIKVWPEGTELVPLGETQQTANRLWTRVRDPEGNVGWVASEFLLDSAIAILTPTVDLPPTLAPQAVVATPVPVQAEPTATFPVLRPTFTPQTAAPPAVVGPTQPPAQAKPGTTPTAAAKPAATAAQPKPAAPQPAPSKPSGAPAPATGADRSAPQGGQCPGGQPIKASAATGAYYVPGGPGYAAVQPDDCFQHEQAAQSAGYSRAR